MSGFDERERAEEQRFAHDEELMFKARARRNKYAGLWAAAKLGLTGPAAEDYAKTVIVADLEKPGDDDVVAKLLADLAPKGVAEHTIRHELAELLTRAIDEIRNG
jgi:hypothetical protein